MLYIGQISYILYCLYWELTNYTISKNPSRKYRYWIFFMRMSILSKYNSGGIPSWFFFFSNGHTYRYDYYINGGVSPQSFLRIIVDKFTNKSISIQVQVFEQFYTTFGLRLPPADVLPTAYCEYCKTNKQGRRYR